MPKHEVTFLPSLTKLLDPTVKLMGLELKTFFEEKINSWKDEKRKDNIVGHIQKIHEREEREKIEINNGNIRQLEEFQEWAEAAQNIDPDDILGNMWQEILISIVKNEESAGFLIEKLKNISKEEALLLIKVNSRNNFNASTDKELYLLKKLYSQELVTKVYIKLVLSVFTTVLPLLILLSFFDNYLDNYSSVYNKTVLYLGIFFIAFTFAYTFIKTNIKTGFSTWSLSWVGRELVKSIPKR